MVRMVGWVYIMFWVWPKNHIENKRGGKKTWVSGDLPRFVIPQYINEQSDITLIKKIWKNSRKTVYIQMSGQKLDPFPQCY